VENVPVKNAEDDATGKNNSKKKQYDSSRASAYKSHNSNWFGLPVGGALNSVSVNNSCKGIFSKG
jgi:hypothetical protein